MPIPTSDRVIFEHRVLARVICQLRFPPILKIQGSDPVNFQDRIRQSYPQYSRDIGGQTIDGQMPQELAAGLVMVPGLADAMRHKFTSADGSREVALSRDFLAVRDSNYERWERFYPEVHAAAEALRLEYAPSYFSRIGLRYIDFIEREKLPGLADVEWNELISPMFIGMLSSENQLRTNISKHLTECIITLDELPSSSVRIVHGVRKLSTGSMQYVFDCDFFMEGQVNQNDLERILQSFHVSAGNLFRWAIRPRLRDALGSRAI